MTDAADFFRSRLDQMIDLRHPLAVLASRMRWQDIASSIAHAFARKVRARLYTGGLHIRVRHSKGGRNRPRTV
jgi:hypothetical protein